ncbi:hypothetical protein B0H14DRAFT_1442060 [Mycena olivaceomarginata]|nr:hypothetical protein B0H14DRAFT_1442060 [Mycena olivaceomarginata]
MARGLIVFSIARSLWLLTMGSFSAYAARIVCHREYKEGCAQTRGFSRLTATSHSTCHQTPYRSSSSACVLELNPHPHPHSHHTDHPHPPLPQTHIISDGPIHRHLHHGRRRARGPDRPAPHRRRHQSRLRRLLRYRIVLYPLPAFSPDRATSTLTYLVAALTRSTHTPSPFVTSSYAHRCLCTSHIGRRPHLVVRIMRIIISSPLLHCINRTVSVYHAVFEYITGILDFVLYCSHRCAMVI